jgi:hypothetical protein
VEFFDAVEHMVVVFGGMYVPALGFGWSVAQRVEIVWGTRVVRIGNIDE